MPEIVRDKETDKGWVHMDAASEGGELPYEHPVEHLLDLMKQVDLLIHREVLRSRQYRDPVNEWGRFAAITEGEAEALLRAGPGSGSSAESPIEDRGFREQLDGLNETLQRRVAEALKAGLSLPLLELSRTFALSSLELDALVVCLAPELDPRYERLYGYLQDGMARRRPSVGLVLSLCCHTVAERLRARSLFSPAAPLLRYQIVQLVDENPGGVPLLSRNVKIADPIVSFLLGEKGFDPRIQDALTLRPAGDRVHSGASARRELVERLIRLAEGCLDDQASGKKPVFYLYGRSGTGRKTVARMVGSHFGLPLLVVDAEQLAASATGFEEGLFLCFREGLLRPAVLYLRHLDRVLGQDHSVVRLKMLARCIGEMGVITFLEGEQPWQWTGLLDQYHFLSITLRLPDYAEQITVWRKLLKGTGGIAENDLVALASKYRFSPKQIEKALMKARRAAALRGENGAVTLEDVYEGCREQQGLGLGTLARRITPKYTWDDLVLPLDQKNQLLEICNHVKYCHTVYGQWGFERKLSLGRGLNMLFSGPPGTGKTMAAEVIGGDLYLDLYKIDLSQILSKYIGETEKHLDQIFREAQASHAILFFDEADALFGKRSEVKDAHDRYANIEIGYLLQKVEEHEGVVILATNLRHNLDEAFVRRMHFVLEFPLPDEEHRCRIWQKAFPKEVPLEGKIDLRFLARQFKLAGGHIKNIALASAFMAAADGASITMAHLIRATKREYQKLGWLCSKADFGPYHELVKERNG